MSATHDPKEFSGLACGPHATGNVWILGPNGERIDVQLAPALTAEEWAEGANDDAYIDSDGLGIYAGTPEAAFSAKEIPSLIALANAALPDDSPYRITRADIALIGNALETIESEYGDDWPAYVALQGLRAKLAALLPPETPPEPKRQPGCRCSCHPSRSWCPNCADFHATVVAD